MPKVALATSHLRSLQPSQPCFEVAEPPLPWIEVVEAKNDLAIEVIHGRQFKAVASGDLDVRLLTTTATLLWLVRAMWQCNWVNEAREAL